MGPPKGLSFVARSGSTWIHWWSPVASANVLTASWVTSNHSLLPSSVPTSPGSSLIVVVVVMPAFLRGHRADVFRDPCALLTGLHTGQGRAQPSAPQGYGCRAGAAGVDWSRG